MVGGRGRFLDVGAGTIDGWVPRDVWSVAGPGRFFGFGAGTGGRRGPKDV